MVFEWNFTSPLVYCSGEFDDITGNARLANPNSTEAKLLVSFPSVGANDSPYWVLDTDYESYSIVWSCTNNNQNSLRKKFKYFAL